MKTLSSIQKNREEELHNQYNKWFGKDCYPPLLAFNKQTTLALLESMRKTLHDSVLTIIELSMTTERTAVMESKKAQIIYLEEQMELIKND